MDGHDEDFRDYAKALKNGWERFQRVLKNFVQQLNFIVETSFRSFFFETCNTLPFLEFWDQ